MDAERARTFLLKLPHVVETTQWGGLVFWIGDKAIGGKMFVLIDPEGQRHPPVSWAVGPERFPELCELEGLRPAPYLAKASWIAAERWSALRNDEWEDQLSNAQALTYAKLPAKVRQTLDLPKAELKRVIAERRRVLALKAAAE